VIDLYQHRVDPDTPIEETVGAMAELVQEGSLAQVSQKRLRQRFVRLLRCIPFLPSRLNILFGAGSQKILPTCRELGIGFVPYSPLGRGFLPVKSRASTLYPREIIALNDTRAPRTYSGNLELVQRIEQMAADKGVKPGQLLAWVLAQGEDSPFPVPSAPTWKRMSRRRQ